MNTSLPVSGTQRGFSLIELMIAMLLGLLVVAAAIAIFTSNRQAYASTQTIGRIQESSQVGFELMARDLREASGNPCDMSLPVANVVNGAAADWWTNWPQFLLGTDNAAAAYGDALAIGDGIQFLSMGNAVVDINSHAGTTFTVAANPFSVGQVLMVCDIRQLAIFEVTSASATTIGHAAAGANCSDSLNVAPAPCAAGAPAYLYPRNAVIGRLQGVRWMVRNNGRGGRSLYRSVDGAVPQEVTDGVTDLQITYLQPDLNATNYVDAATVTNWANVRAARIAMTLTGAPGTEVGGVPVTRTVQNVVNFRNRML